MFRHFQLINSYRSSCPGLVSVFGVFMMTQFFEVSAAEWRGAIVDARGDFRVFFQFYLPLARPALATLALLNVPAKLDACVAMIVAPNPDMSTLQVDWRSSASRRRWQNQVMRRLWWRPSVASFPIAQRQLSAGIAAGAVRSDAQQPGRAESVLGGDNCDSAGCL